MKKICLIASLLLLFCVSLTWAREEVDINPSNIEGGITAYYRTLNTPSLNSDASGATVTQLSNNGKSSAGTSIYGVSSIATIDLNVGVNVVYLKSSALGGTSIYFTNAAQKAGYYYKSYLLLVQNATGTGGVGWCSPLTGMKSGVSPIISTTANVADYFALEVNGAVGSGATVEVTMTKSGR